MVHNNNMTVVILLKQEKEHIQIHINVLKLAILVFIIIVTHIQCTFTNVYNRHNYARSAVKPVLSIQSRDRVRLLNTSQLYNQHEHLGSQIIYL